MRLKLPFTICSLILVVLSIAVTDIYAYELRNQNISEKNEQIVKSFDKDKLTLDFYRNLQRLKEECGERDYCDYMYAEAARAFDAMIAACDYNEGSQACADAQNMVHLIAVVTLHYCASSKYENKKNVIELFYSKLQLITSRSG